MLYRATSTHHRRTIARNRRRAAIPPLVAVGACAVWALFVDIAGTSEPQSLLPVFALVIVTLAVAGAATPLPLIEGAVPVRRQRQAMLVAVAASVPFVVALLVNPDRLAGGPAPLLADRVPIFGWLFDGVMSALPLAVDTPAYNLVFSAFTLFGFYLECVLVAVVLYAALRLIPSLDPDSREEGRPNRKR
ncbi:MULTISPECIES: hypothetical protein [unclassified Methanoculleus]|jgi:hypothetical protein|uniref:Uncharacterized protein n=1 Tax=Methanoculleus palmolei TaxID=72612 RepID=A0ABD8ABC5_9EURY|nr:hypothetical protein [Methanoculleus sp. UBA377]MDD2472919.1 hypothetical protein [Methanoculleus sp.]WOX56495.1 hypothetical protein R6Y95_03970 [Methanoculleus palmolei]